MPNGYPNLTLTFLLEHRGFFLLVRRGLDENHFPGYWAFPGGKVEMGETIIDTLRREIDEETKLPLTGKFVMLDAYAFRQSTGIAFLLRVKNRKVVPFDFDLYKWISKPEDLKPLKRIPGIDNHLLAAKAALKKRIWFDLENIQLSVDKYLNH